MARHCSICTHPARLQIDRALIGAAGYRDIAGRYGLSKSAVARHRAEHIPERLGLVRQ